LFLAFPSSINIGNIGSYSVVKPTIDCLYSWLGGRAGAPDDHRIANLAVSKAGDDQPDQGISIRLWAHGRVDSQLTAAPAQVSGSWTSRPPRPSKGFTPAQGAIRNPCIQGTCKWIVCEGALSSKMIDEVVTDLEQAYPGSGRRIKEYVADLLHENGLDIRLEQGRVVCMGRLG
jgi:hypothetical protein